MLMIGNQKLERRYHLLPCPLAPLPRTAKQRGCGNKTPFFGASEAFCLKLNFWSEPSCCQGCTSVHRDRLASIKHPKRNGPYRVLTTALLPARCARVCSAQRPGGHGPRLPALCVQSLGSVNQATGRQASPLSSFLLTNQSQKANRTYVTMSDP